MVKLLVVPTGLSEDDDEGLHRLDEVAIVFPLETCRVHKGFYMQPESIQWSSQIKFFSLGYRCTQDECQFSLKVLHDTAE